METNSNLVILEGQSSQREITGQVAEAIHTFMEENDVSLPEWFVKQIQESVFVAVEAFADSNQVDPSMGSTAKTIRLAIHLILPEARNENGAFSTAQQWGFFLVQKRGGQEGAPQLFLDLNLYQE